MCIIAVLWFGPQNANESRVTRYRIFANESNLSNDSAELITESNEVRISSLFPIPGLLVQSMSVIMKIQEALSLSFYLMTSV